ncbi:MAG TPA: ABC transporter permease subunit [Actinomycetota bacterium]|nr:ABC transporter permease subunit [Actinomycetota bacterium]
MLRNVLAKTIRDQRVSLGWWAVGLVAACLLTTMLYPSVRENAESLSEVIETLPEGLRRALVGASADFFSPTGYLQARLFALFVPLLLLMYTIGAGSRAIAGEEERKTMDVLLSTPVTRRRVLLDKTLAMVAALAGLCVVIWLALVVTGPPFDVSVGPGTLAAGVANAFLLALAFGGIALAVGAGTGRRSLAVGVAAGLASGTYLVDVLALSVDGLEWLERATPFFYYRSTEALVRGLDAVNAGVLLGIAAVAIGVAFVTFERRDLAA